LRASAAFPIGVIVKPA